METARSLATLPVEVVLDGLDDLPGRHEAEEGAGVRDGEVAEAALVGRVLLAARLPLVVVLDLGRHPRQAEQRRVLL